MTRFFERYLEGEKVDDVACAREDRLRESEKMGKKDEIANYNSRAQATMSTNIDRKHRFPACMRCLNYSWKAEGNLMRPWCEKIDAGVFELRACPKGLWERSHPIFMEE